MSCASCEHRHSPLIQKKKKKLITLGVFTRSMFIINDIKQVMKLQEHNIPLDNSWQLIIHCCIYIYSLIGLVTTVKES